MRTWNSLVGVFFLASSIFMFAPGYTWYIALLFLINDVGFTYLGITDSPDKSL